MMLIFALMVMAFDQLTKTAAESWGWVTVNTGISFGFLSAIPSSALTIGLLGIVISSWYMFRRAWAQVPLAAALFIGGALSNLIDRWRLSGVRDWLLIPGTTIHNNLADYAIGLGLVLLVAHFFRHGHHQLQMNPNPPTTETSTTTAESKES